MFLSAPAWPARVFLAIVSVALVTAGEVAGQVSLARDLVVDGEFGFVSALAADQRGHVYVADAMAQQLHVFDAQGRRLPALGRRGSGPGEFQGVVSVVAGRGDTLFTFDVSLQRITAFAPGERRVAYSVTVPVSGGERGSYQLLVPDEGAFLLPFASPRGPGEAQAPTVSLRSIGHDGRVGGGALSRTPDREALEVVRGTQRSVGPLPYGRAPGFAVHGGRVYHGWSGSGDIPFFDTRGRRLGTLRTRAGSTQLERGHLRALVESYPAGDQRRQDVSDAIRERRIPAQRPVWKQILADDAGRLWVSVVTDDDVVVFNDAVGFSYASYANLGQGGAGSTPWWVFSADGTRRAIYLLPNNVRLHQVSGGRAYGVEVDADGVQRLVRFVVPAS